MNKPPIYTIETVANGYVIRNATKQAMPVETWDSTFVFESFESMSSWLGQQIGRTKKDEDSAMIDEAIRSADSLLVGR